MGGLRLTGPGNSPQLDTQATLGLLGTSNSLAYRVEEIEKHVHSRNYCYGKAAGDELLIDSLVPFRCTAGAIGVYGALTTISAGGVIPSVKADIGRIVVTAASGNAGDIYLLTLYYGTAAADTVLTSLYYVVPGAGLGKASGIVIPCPRIMSNAKIGAKVKCSNADETIDFLIDIHTYAG